MPPPHPPHTLSTLHTPPSAPPPAPPPAPAPAPAPSRTLTHGTRHLASSHAHVVDLRGDGLEAGAAVPQQLRNLLAGQVLVKAADAVHLAAQARVRVRRHLLPRLPGAQSAHPVAHGERPRAHLQHRAALHPHRVALGVVRGGVGGGGARGHKGQGLAVERVCARHAAPPRRLVHHRPGLHLLLLLLYLVVRAHLGLHAVGAHHLVDVPRAARVAERVAGGLAGDACAHGVAHRGLAAHGHLAHHLLRLRREPPAAVERRVVHRGALLHGGGVPGPAPVAVERPADGGHGGQERVADGVVGHRGGQRLVRLLAQHPAGGVRAREVRVRVQLALALLHVRVVLGGGRHREVVRERKICGFAAMKKVFVLLLWAFFCWFPHVRQALFKGSLLQLHAELAVATRGA
mmetsp:Transcript_12979/g.31330  ORF Transcript_12979/g.31330 Transcript_12979/m.31330 type:complete len:403 (+) Transcript_12979:244-1452(+)